jgi:hypothetical protein
LVSHSLAADLIAGKHGDAASEGGTIRQSDSLRRAVFDLRRASLDIEPGDKKHHGQYGSPEGGCEWLVGFCDFMQCRYCWPAERI